MNTREEIRKIRIQEWKKVIEDRIASGLTAKEYCQRMGITKDQYYYWQRLVREEALEEMKRPSEGSRFAELSIPTTSEIIQSEATSAVTINIGKCSITVQDKESLKTVGEVLLNAQ